MTDGLSTDRSSAPSNYPSNHPTNVVQQQPSSLVHTPFSATCLRFHPSVPHLLAVGTAQNFGIAGKGCQHVVALGPSRPAAIQASFMCEQAILDCAWSEAVPSVLAASLGDGSIVLWDIQDKRAGPLGSPAPLLKLLGHQRECCSLDWNIQQPNLLLSASWDASLRLWDIAGGRELLHLPGVHHQSIYGVSWCPSQPSVLASCGADGTFRVLDTRENNVRGAGGKWITKSLGQQTCHNGEALSLDWNKFSPFVLATSGTDSLIRIWDIRKIQASPQSADKLVDNCLSSLMGHSMAVRKIRWSPFRDTVLASSGYDMSVAVWDCRQQFMKFRFRHHSEFVNGIDWSLFEDGVIASGSWDRTVGIWNALSGVGPVQRSPQTQMTPGLPKLQKV